MKNTGKLGSEKGFALLETLLALSIVSVTVLFFGSFLIPQMKLFYEHDRRTQGKAMCSEAHVKLEALLRYGYIYSFDPAKPEELAFYTREEGSPRTEDGFTRLPGTDTWPVLSAEDLDVNIPVGMSLRLNFEGTTSLKAEVNIQAVLNESVVYEQAAVIGSLYCYEMREGSIP